VEDRQEFKGRIWPAERTRKLRKQGSQTGPEKGTGRTQLSRKTKKRNRSRSSSENEVKDRKLRGLKIPERSKPEEKINYIGGKEGNAGMEGKRHAITGGGGEPRNKGGRARPNASQGDPVWLPWLSKRIVRRER